MLRNLSRLDVTSLAKRFGTSERAVLLGCAVATWPYIPYQVLRKCRRLVNHELPAHVEAEFCRSPLVDGCAIDGFSLHASFRCAALSHLRAYRTQASKPQEAHDDLRALRELLSANYSRLSPLLAIEADLAWDYILLDGATLCEKVDERLRRVLLTAVDERRYGVLDWVAGASARLPPECIHGDAAWLLNQLCAAENVEMAPVVAPSAVTPERLMELVSERLPLAIVGVHRGRGFLEFGPPSRERSIGVVLVGTEPRFVFVRERRPKPGLPVSRSVPMSRGEVTRVECGDDEIVLGNLVGQTFTLARLENGRCPEAVTADRVIRKAMEARAQRVRQRATVIRPVDAGYVVSLDEIGATAFLLSPRWQLCEGDELIVVIDRVYEDKRWISAVAANYPAEFHNADRNVVLRVPAALIPQAVEPWDVFPAKLVKHGAIKEGRRSAHVYIDPQCLLGGITLDTRPGHLRFGAAVRRHGEVWEPPIGASMEIVVSGMVEQDWELRLRRASRLSESKGQKNPLTPGTRTTATVTVVSREGAKLEALHGEPLWLPRNEVVPVPPEGKVLPLRVGDLLDVRVLRHSVRYPGCLLASQRAVMEPYLDRIKLNSAVSGRIERQLPDGEFVVAVDPIQGIAKNSFGAITSGAVQQSLYVTMRVSARAARINTRRWVLVVKELQPI